MKELHNWFDKHKRPFPWRENPSPYKVWISEVMLQQTRATVVVPYFLRWLDLFPDISALSQARIEQVIKAWEGLGYYSRARNLHAGALQIMQNFEGRIPKERENLRKIRGLGPYTIGAILSFGFRQRAAAVDGNVVRVLTRYFAIEKNVARADAKREIQQKAEEILDFSEPWVTAEALIELGATLCLPQPKCQECPLKTGCQGFKQNKTLSLPIKNEPQKIIDLRRFVAVIEVDGKILLKKGKPGQVMADLYEFPYFEERKGLQKMQKDWSLKTEKRLKTVKHTFTMYRATLYPVFLTGEKKPEIPNCQWISKEEFGLLPFSSGHRKIAQEILCGFSI